MVPMLALFFTAAINAVVPFCTTEDVNCSLLTSGRDSSSARRGHKQAHQYQRVGLRESDAEVPYLMRVGGSGFIFHQELY
jgi:hypothetical protein